MAELSVSANYDSKVVKTARAALSVTFPLWGIVAPIIGIGMSIILIAGIISGHTTSASELIWAAVPIAWLAVGVFGLLAMRLLKRNRLFIDKTGIQFPFFLKPVHSTVPWAAIKRAEIRSEIGTKADNKTLLIYLDHGSPVKVKLSNLKANDVEQVLLAIEVWGKDCDCDHSLVLLQDTLKSKAEDSGKLSYTTMWEDELRRKFSATTFLPLTPGQVLYNGRLKIVRHLSLGGLSAVYLCQLDENQLVVLKEAVLPEDNDSAMREKAIELFERESTFLKKLDYKGIVRVIENFAESGRNYLMLEYVNGQDLRQYIKQNGAQKESTVIEWAIQAAGIMKYLHEQTPPIVHRDLSPDNLVLREDGSLIVIDFGAANEMLSKATGTFVGKQAFISPEQFRGKAVTQSDIYAFGCTLFFCLTGKEPEALSSSDAKEVNPDVSDEFNEIIVCCTQMDPKDRYQSAAQLLPVLRRMQSTVRVS